MNEKSTRTGQEKLLGLNQISGQDWICAREVGVLVLQTLVMVSSIFKYSIRL